LEKQLLSERVLACAVRVHKILGIGFLEKVYENALLRELRKAGLFVEQQKPITVLYDGDIVGEFVADLVIENTLILELKAIRKFSRRHVACCMNYLRATRLPVCLLLNFGDTRIQIKRIVGDSYINCPNPI
jgi:GxxExxY protein